MILLLTCIGASPAIAQTTSTQAQSPVSFVPQKLNLKDEQNIDFLYGLYEVNKDKIDFSTLSFEGNVEDVLDSRKSLAEFYYSPAREAFNLRESMKLIRAMSCKTSRVTGVRGIDLLSKLKDFASQKVSPEQELPEEFLVIFWKGAYEHFCPNLW